MLESTCTCREIGETGAIYLVSALWGLEQGRNGKIGIENGALLKSTTFQEAILIELFQITFNVPSAK